MAGGACAGLTRAVGGWMSDRWGPRAVMYRVFAVCVLGLAALCVPRMDIRSPGEGVMATRAGVVQEVSPTGILVSGRLYPLRSQAVDLTSFDDRMLVLPTLSSWQEPVVEAGEAVALVDGIPMKAALSGVLRGLLPDGIRVRAGRSPTSG